MKKLFVALVIADWLAAGAALARLERRVAQLENRRLVDVRIDGQAVARSLAAYDSRRGQ